MTWLQLHGFKLVILIIKKEFKMGKRRLPARVKSGKNKGQFKKRKGSKSKKKGRRRVGRPRKKR